jgi:ergothioneine biosynthesis protein EgtB
MSLLDRYAAVRAATVALTRPLSAEDQMVQSMPDASPTKWHLAHTSWFFETFVLGPHDAGYRAFDPRFAFLFNSYYEGIGPRIARDARGLISRPSLDDVQAYRRSVDGAVARLLERRGGEPPLPALMELGLQHEQQHQELILTDIKHALAANPLRPAYRQGPASAPDRHGPAPGDPELRRHEGGLVWIGHEGPGFAFDNEGPRHRCFLRPFAIAERPVSCGEYLRFVRDGGYRRPELWLSDGWHERERQGWHAPLYWEPRGDGPEWELFTLSGPRPVDEREAVVHVSYYEADAFARWRGMRLPTEAEWEHAAGGEPIAGHFADAGLFHPGSVQRGFFGEVWQWTQSPYTPYPGYRTPAGPVGEYNGKFMSNQMVLRGGSCLTPAGHIRPTYRNFFPPASRWQASGIRLGCDA